MSTALPPPVPSQDDNLRLLSIFYYIFAVITALCGSVPIIHVAIGFMALVGGVSTPMISSGGPAPQSIAAGAVPALFGLFFMVIGCGLVLLAYTFAYFLFKTAGCLTMKRRWTMCVVVAAFACTQFPFGTILGIFTLIILTKPEVRAEFDRNDQAPLPTYPPPLTA